MLLIAADKAQNRFVAALLQSSLSLEGNYVSSSNGFGCAQNGLESHMMSYMGKPDQLLITPVIGSGNSSMILKFDEDRWTLQTVTNLPYSQVI